MPETQNITNTTAPFEFKGSLFTLTILQLNCFNMERIRHYLSKKIEQAPNFFTNAPIVIDFHQVNTLPAEIALGELIDLLHEQQLLPVGICSASDSIKEQAKAFKLAVLPRQTPQPNRPSDPQHKKEELMPSSSTKVITQSVRSGQQIYAKGSDLIVVGSVSHGAELLADGNIHIYGTLRGRALAGINGNQQARIFCQNLDAELVSIAGLYQLSEDFVDKQPTTHCQIYLQNDRIHIAAV
jgi:septum site-determining protein MinC